jgi:hypothetical protein
LDTNLQAKKNRPEGRLFFAKLITSKQLEQQQPKRLEQRQRPKQQEQQRQEQQRQPLVLVLEQQLEQLLEQLLELEQQELLLFWSKQPEQQPAGKRSAGIFSWVFLKIQN